MNKDISYSTRQFKAVANRGEKRRVAALTRVSTQHEQQINALENQNQWILSEVARHNDWIFNVDEDLYVDEGVSGTSTANRIGFLTMIERAKNGDYDLIITREVSRFMRNLKLTLVLVDELKSCGVEVYFINDNIWSFNDEDYFKLSLMGSMAEQESKKTSERASAGQEVARKKGVIFGNGNILGYDLKRGDKSVDNTYIINEEQAETVRRIYTLCLEGNGLRKIAQVLREEKRKNSVGEIKWYDSSIGRILRNPTYCGRIEYLKSYTEDPITHKRRNQKDKTKRPTTKGKFEPIIPEDMWEAAQKELDSRINHNLNNNQNGRGIMISSDVYCRKMRCECGRRFRKDKGRKRGMASYRCYNIIENGSVKLREKRGLSTEGYCSLPGIIDWKLGLYTKRVFERLSIKADEIKTAIINSIEESYIDKENEKKSPKDMNHIRQEIEKLERKIDNLIDMRSDGEITKEQFSEKKREAELKIMEKRSILDKNENTAQKIKNKDKCIQMAKEYLEQVFGFEGGVISVELIDMYVNSIKVYNDNTFEYNIKLKSDTKSDRPEDDNDRYQICNADSVHKIDNSEAKILDEFTIGYDEAKAYANNLGRKVNRLHWQNVTIRIVVDV